MRNIKPFTIVLCWILSCSVFAEEIFIKFDKSYSISAEDAVNRTREISVGLILVDLKKHRDLPNTNSVYGEILSYSKQAPFGDKHGRSTNAHETVHGINSELRNHYKTVLKKNVNGFYAGDGKGIVLLNPKLTLRDIVPNIPAVLRGYRYNLYFVQQLGDWNEVPTYPMDEWTAYIAGAECAIDDDKQGINIQKSDYVSGALEFSIYCTALAMSVKDKDPEYWKDNEQFKNAIKYYLIKSEKAFFEGKNKFTFKQQDELLSNLREHPDATDIRNFLLNEFDGIFVD